MTPKKSASPQLGTLRRIALEELLESISKLVPVKLVAEVVVGQQRIRCAKH